MGFIGLLKELISVVVIANAVTGQKNEGMSEEYVKTLETILKSGDR